MDHVPSIPTVSQRHQSRLRCLEKALPTFKLKSGRPVGLMFASVGEKDPMLKLTKVFGVRVREKEPEVGKYSKPRDPLHNQPACRAIWTDQSEPDNTANSLEIRTSHNSPNLPCQMKRRHTLTFTHSLQAYTNTITAKVNTLYKRKADKVHPVNYGGPSGDTPSGIKNWLEECLKHYHSHPTWDKLLKFNQHLNPQITNFPQGTHLSLEQAEQLMVGTKLTGEEKELLLKILFKQEGTLAWGFEDVG